MFLEAFFDLGVDMNNYAEHFLIVCHQRQVKVAACPTSSFISHRDNINKFNMLKI